MRGVQWVWQFQKELRDAYVWHRCTGETRRLKALVCAWRTALALMEGLVADATPLVLVRLLDCGAID
jgi:hypothetical protein